MTVKEIIDLFDFDCKMKYKVEPSYEYFSRKRFDQEYYYRNELWNSPYANLEVIRHKIYVDNKEVVLTIFNKDYIITQRDFIAEELSKYNKLLDEFDDSPEKDLHGEEND